MLKTSPPAQFVAAMRAAVERGQLARAVELYRGDLMPGFYLTDCHDFDAWLESERSALLEEAVAAAWALAKHLESGSNYTDASRLAKKAARLDRTNERALRRSLKMLDRLGVDVLDDVAEVRDDRDVQFFALADDPLGLGREGRRARRVVDIVLRVRERDDREIRL